MDNTREEMLERSLPHNPEAEQQLQGSIILDNGLMAEAIEFALQPGHFYIRAHQFIWAAMIALFERGSEISAMLIAEELKREGQFEQVGGYSFISALTHGLPFVSSIKNHAKVIKNNATMRQGIRVGNKITSEFLEAEDEVGIMVEHAQQMTFALSDDDEQKQTYTAAGTLAHASLQKAYNIQQQGTAITGLPTGLTDLDSQTLGLQRTDAIVIAARPSMGKTALSVQIGTAAAVESGELVLYFSLEMNKEQIINRALCNLARIDSQKFRSGYINATEWERLHHAEQLLAQSRLFVDDTPGITTLQMRAKMRRLSIQQQSPLGLVVVDYIQLMSNTSKSRNTESRQQEITQISRELKGLAKEFNVPLIIDSQLSRAPENRTDHRPQLSDLRESGSIEQDADLVAFIYREDKYRKSGEELTHTAEIILAKQRNGPTGPNVFRFDETTGRFDNISHQYQG